MSHMFLMTPFDPYVIREHGGGGFKFECEVIWGRRPLFKNHENHHSLAAKLVEVGVLDETCRDLTTPKSLVLFVLFETMDLGEGFRIRLNDYLLRKVKALNAAYEL